MSWSFLVVDGFNKTEKKAVALFQSDVAAKSGFGCAGGCQCLFFAKQSMGFSVPMAPLRVNVMVIFGG